MKNFLRTMTFLLIISLVFAGSVYALGLPQRYVFLSDNGGEFVKYSTSSKTVEDFLTEREIELDDLDTVSCALDTATTENMMIRIRRAFNVFLQCDGAEVMLIKTNCRTLAEFALYYSELTGRDYRYDEDLAGQELREGSRVRLTGWFKEILEERQPLPYEVVYIENEGVSSEELVSEGREGQKLIRTELSYEYGYLVGSIVQEEIVEIEPVKRIVYVPTEKAVLSSEAESIAYGTHYTMKATAYTLSPVCVGKYYYGAYHGLTASGMKAQVGVVAVDPKVIPLGTKLYISGYGYAIAGDTGGAIKGNKIDLFFDTLNECYQYGVRQVDVYVVLDDGN